MSFNLDGIRRFCHKGHSAVDAGKAQSAIARAFLLTTRYIDDLASINNPYLHSLLYVDQHFHHSHITGIYPRTLLVTTADSGVSINYMDVTMQRQHGSRSRITTVLYDKREHSPLADQFIIKFPHTLSNISTAAKYGVITSQYHRFRRIIMLRDDFTSRMAGLVHYMQSKGHDTSRMLKQVRGLCNRFIELYGTDPRRLVQDIHQALTRLTASHATRSTLVHFCISIYTLIYKIWQSFPHTHTYSPHTLLYLTFNFIFSWQKFIFIILYIFYLCFYNFMQSILNHTMSRFMDSTSKLTDIRNS